MGVTEIVSGAVLAVCLALSCFLIAKISGWILARDEEYERVHAKDKETEEGGFKAYWKGVFANMKKYGIIWIVKAPVSEFTGYTGKELTFTPKKQKVSAARLIFAVVVGGLCGGLLAYKFGIDAKFFFMTALFILLFVIAFVDADTMEIPPYLNYLILFMGIASIWVVGDVPFIERIIGMACISVPMMILDAIIPEAFGWGDIKLMFAAGFLLGWKVIVAGFLFGIFIGGFIGVVVLIRKKKGGKDHMPFGPSLCIGIAFAVLYGNDVINWYADMLTSQMTP
ncbi:Type IV leader peptidase family protein [Eubacterium ruminantium]|nr:Type IV leader peptidase family protein [Eubacterium ruminantium]